MVLYTFLGLLDSKSAEGYGLECVAINSICVIWLFVKYYAYGYVQAIHTHRVYRLHD